MSDALLPQFISEGRDLAEQAGQTLLAIEAGAGDQALGAALRAFHTLKGSAALFDLAELGALMHAAEDRLEQARAAGAPDPEVITLLLEAVSETERWLGAMEATGEPTETDRVSAARLTRALATGEPALAEGERPAASAEWAHAAAARLAPNVAGVAIRYRPHAEAYFQGDDPLALMERVPGLVWLGLERGDDGSPRDGYDPFHCDLVLTGLSHAPVPEVQAVFRLVRDQVETVQVRGRAATEASRALRIAPERIDELAALLDEAIIAKNALAHAIGQAAGGEALRSVLERQAALDRTLSDLHGAVAGLRLAPLAPLFDRLSRQARELAGQLGKAAELVVEGGEVAVDKDVAGGLLEPLVHLLRNALDHGIEPQEERLARGKPARATLRLSAHTEGAEAVIELSDDGRGLDVSRIRALGAERGLLAADEAAALSEEAAHELVFASGFSTAGQGTDVSGRGVGLDAVRAAISRLGGRVSLSSRPGLGSTARLSVPLRAVLTRLAVVAAGGQRYGAALQSIREVVRLPKAEVASIRAGRAFVLNDEVLPLLSLAEVMGGAAPEPDTLTVVVIERGGRAVGVAVDRVGERIEAPVRPASGLLSSLPGLQGTFVEGDGRVLMVLDLEALTA